MPVALPLSRLRLLLVAVLAIALAAPVAGPAAAQDPEPYLQLIQTVPNKNAVRAGDVLLVDGWAPAGVVSEVRLLGTRADGTTFSHDYPAFVPQGDGTQTEWVRRDEDGTISGRISVPCPFDYEHRVRGSLQACASDVEVWRAQLEIVVGGQTLRSNRGGSTQTPGVWRVDSLHPIIRQYEQLALDRIRVVFTEPVRLPRAEDEDSPTDWRIDNAPSVVRTVENPNEDPNTPDDCVYRPGEDPAQGPRFCTRILTLDRPLPPDLTPIVRYNPGSAGNVSFRDAYQDFARLQLRYGNETGTNPSAAIDLVRPAIPSIEEIAGRETEDGQVLANDPAPQVRVGNVSKGDDVTVTATGANGATVSKTVTVAEDASPTNPDGGTVTVTLDRLPADGHYVIGAVAVDENGNRSDEREKGPERADGSPNPVSYVLDTVVPHVVAAGLETPRRVAVEFNEAVAPDGQAGRWTVNGQEATAEGSGRSRRLTTSNDIQGEPVVVEWRPDSTLSPVVAARYRDAAGNELEPLSFTKTISLPAIVAPNVLQPAGEAYTKASSQVISGTAPDGTTVDLLERSTSARVGSTQANGGTWTFSQTLPADGRYRFDVQSRNDATGSRSARTPVPDIIRDTINPLLTVRSPSPDPTEPGGTPRRGVGGTVTVEWLGSDPALTDQQRPDHGAGVDIDIIFTADNTRRAIARNEPHTPNQPRTFTYTITPEDLAGLGSREARFEVTLRDLAGNATSSTSAPIRIVADLLDYAPVLVERGVIEARFPVALTGETSGTEWFVDGKPAQRATREQRDGRSVVRITDETVRDPNATPTIRYQPAPASPAPLRGERGAEISTALRLVADGIAPALTITSRQTQGVVVDSESTRLGGTTDGDTSRPNTIHVFRADASGNPTSGPVASTQPDSEGRWTVDVPLRPDHRNELVVQAVDPNSNRSQALPQPPALVIEDSTPPVVSFTNPTFGAAVGPTVPLKWALTEANLLYLVVDYRVDGGEWRRIQQLFDNPGQLSFEIPADEVEDTTLGFRVTATDKTGKTGEAVVDGVHVDLAPPQLMRARATGAQVVDVTFSEPVTVDGSGFTIDGATVRRVKGAGLTRTFILNRAVTTTTPTVEYTGTTVTNDAGIEMEPTTVRAKRSFAFAVTDLRGQRRTTNRVRVTWTDTRNRAADLRGYRVYRNGSAIALVGSSTRAFTDTKGAGGNIYSVRAVDDRRRVSSVRRITVR